MNITTFKSPHESQQRVGFTQLERIEIHIKKSGVIEVEVISSREPLSGEPRMIITDDSAPAPHLHTEILPDGSLRRNPEKPI